jgi:transcription antitermination factor NusG
MQNTQLTGKRWHILMVRVGAEKQAVELLKDSELEVEVYCPCREVWRRVGQHEARKIGARGKPVKVPLYPGYMFVKADTGVVSVRSIGLATGLAGGRVLVANGRAACVSGAFVAALQEGEASGQWDLAQIAVQNWLAKVGQSLLIQSGPLRGFIGVLKAVDLGGLSPNVTMAVEMFGKSVEVTVDVSLEAVVSAK